ncbi:hypothetical protein MKW98_030676 [Papaver atlanticum]|uniref:PCI domain-containing protein n=1 Tax=Papaver atlanticum TaxID=357466 RepID=A0AAD4RTZ8_9MAGN|nr:hypothetical protein MKW98_030676 [Papaver atlanticum]
MEVEKGDFRSSVSDNSSVAGDNRSKPDKHVKGLIQFSYQAPDMFLIQDDEVEEWIVKAIIDAKLLDCKMDQLNQTIIVSRCSDRLFGPNQWGYPFDQSYPCGGVMLQML